MTLDDYEYLRQNLNTGSFFGCDCSLVNIFLYQKKYQITSKIIENTLCRNYQGEGINSGWGFPLPLKNARKDFLQNVLKNLINQKDKLGKLKFTYISENQKKLIDDCLNENFPDYKIIWKNCDDFKDYIYLQEKLSSLAGSQMQKKRNHVKKFQRIYENRWTFKTFPENQIKTDILKVENQWFEERTKTEISASEFEDLSEEKELIKVAVENAESLGIKAGVLYINGEPQAMCIASAINEEVCDIHFEKALSESAEKGAYAEINYLFAQTLSSYKYINREEDLGIEGLRKAKLSYKPDILLNKYFGEMVRG